MFVLFRFLSIFIFIVANIYSIYIYFLNLSVHINVYLLTYLLFGRLVLDTGMSGWNWTLHLNRTHLFVTFAEVVNFLDKITKKHTIFISVIVKSWCV
jgi:hypothetical protein